MLTDCHRHWAVNNQADFVKDIINQMDSDNISRTVLFGYNGLRFNKTEHSQDIAVIDAFKAEPFRIIPFLCDFNFDEVGLAYVTKHLSEGVFKGIGEILLGHSTVRKSAFPNVFYDSKEAKRIFHAVAEFSVPILVHVDPPFIENFCRLLESCPQGKFIWAHCAYDFTLPFGGKEKSPKWLEALLTRHENLMFDISMWKISPLYLIDEKWLRLLESHSDRFLFGTDMTGPYTLQSVWMRSYEFILRSLSTEAICRIGYENLIGLIKK